MRDFQVEKRTLDLSVEGYKFRSMPNYFLRSAIFGLSQTNDATSVEIIIPCLTDSIHSNGAVFHNLRYKGDKLGQYDYDVFQIISEIWHKNGKPNKLQLTSHAILKLLEKSPNSDSYKALSASIGRLSSCIFTLDTPDDIWTSSLLSRHENKKTKTINLTIHENFSFLFESDKLSYQAFALRKSISGDLAKWLFNFYSSHRSSSTAPQRHKLSFIKELCGSESETKVFRYYVKKALKELTEKKCVGSVDFDDLDDDILTVTPLHYPKTSHQSITATTDEAPKTATKKKGTGRGSVAL